MKRIGFLASTAALLLCASCTVDYGENPFAPGETPLAVRLSGDALVQGVLVPAPNFPSGEGILCTYELEAAVSGGRPGQWVALEAGALTIRVETTGEILNADFVRDGLERIPTNTARKVVRNVLISTRSAYQTEHNVTFRTYAGDEIEATQAFTCDYTPSGG